jgi:uracil phosphoribosyltransferase
MTAFIFNHPLINDKLARLRDRGTEMAQFRLLVEQITMLMLYEVARELPQGVRELETPLVKAPFPVLAGDPPVLIPVLRAGLVMVAPLLELLPECPVGHVGLARDHETLEPHTYYVNLPQALPGRAAWVLDPMLATGGSAGATLSLLKKHGAGALSVFSLIAAPEGLQRLEADHPDVRVFAAALDEKLNDKGYILPGLGDAGDRVFGTI